MKTIKFIMPIIGAAIATTFCACDLDEMLNEKENSNKEYSYANDMGGTTTEYGTTSWNTLSNKATFISKFDAVTKDLNYSTVATGVVDGNNVEEVSFGRATTDDEIAPYIKKIMTDNYILTFEDDCFKAYKIDSEGVKYEFQYGSSYYLYRKTEFSSFKKNDALKQYAEDLKNKSNTKIFVSWAEIKKSSPWIQAYPELSGTFNLYTTDSTGNTIYLYKQFDYEAINQYYEKLKKNEFAEPNNYDESEKEINGNLYKFSYNYDGLITFERILQNGSSGNNDYIDNQEENNNSEENQNETPEENNNSDSTSTVTPINADDFNADGYIDWRDKFYKLVARNGVSTQTRQTYNGEVSLYNFTATNNAIQVYDSAASFDGEHYYYDFSVNGGQLYKYIKNAWRYTSRVYKDSNKPADECMKSTFSTMIYFAAPSWGVANSTIVTSNWTKVGSRTYAGRQCTEYTYSSYTYYIDDETDICLYYNGAGYEFETLTFTVGTTLTLPNYRKYQIDLPTNLKIETKDVTNFMGTWTTNTTIIKLGNEWMCTSGTGDYSYWKFNADGTTQKAMVKYDGDEEWTSVLDESHWQDFDYFAQNCDFSFIFSNSTPKGDCYKDCNPTNETITVCGVECVKYEGIDVLNTNMEFYVNESNNVVYKSAYLSDSEITSWDTSVTAFEIPAP